VGDHPDLDVDRVVEALDRHGVQYLLIGGVAARFHGSVRRTEDIDVLPRDDEDNLERLASALRDLGAFLRVGGMSDEEARALPVVLDAYGLRRMEVSTWRTSAGDLDVLRTLRDEGGGRLAFQDLEARAVRIVVNGLDVHLAGLRDIVASKRFADRDKDREALPELEALLERDEG
jgi:hypothetical protein